MPADRRRWVGPTPLGEEVRRELARFGPQAGMAELVARWPAAVGPSIARFAWPARIGRDGTVHVNTADSVWAFELGHRAGEMAERLGVRAIRFAPGPLPAPEHEEAVPETAVPSAAEDARAGEIAAAIGDDRLREIVQRAVALGLARSAADRRI